MVRVIGRIDAAQAVQLALASAGVEAFLVTGGPTDAAENAPPERTVADVVVGAEEAVGTCMLIKKRAPRRPVLAATPKRSLAYAAWWALSRRGPDALVLWPATDTALQAGIAQAIDRAKVPRPRFPGAHVAAAIGLFFASFVGVVGVWGKVFICGIGPCTAMLTTRYLAYELLQCAGFIGMGLFAWFGPPVYPSSRGRRVLGSIFLLMGVLGGVGALSLRRWMAGGS